MERVVQGRPETLTLGAAIARSRSVVRFDAVTTRSAAAAFILGVATLVAGVRAVEGSCNLIPAPQTGFASDSGTVATPFGRPQQTVLIRQAAPIFSADATRNRVSVAFTPPGAEVATIDGLASVPGQCSGGQCATISFAFPDTDAGSSASGERYTRTGPVTIRVETDGIETALIGGLRDEQGDPHPLFPSFVALPPANDFAAFRAAPRDMLGATDGHGNVFVPLDFRGVRPQPNGPMMPLIQVVEATIPGLDALSPDELSRLNISLFSPDGHRLAGGTFVAGGDVIGTADGPESVLRLEVGSWVGDHPQYGGTGPVILPGITGFADPRKLMDGATVVAGQRFFVYDNPECSPFVLPESCVDLDCDGHTDGHFLRALDVTVPRAEPLEIQRWTERQSPGSAAWVSGWCSWIDAFYGALTSGDIAFPPHSVFQFRASDDIVQYSLPETWCFDLNLDGVNGQSMVQGAFDLGRAVAIPLAAASVRREVAGPLVAFTVPDPSLTADALHVYDARAGAELPVLAAGGGPFLLTRRDDPPMSAADVGTVPSYRVWGYAQAGAEVDGLSDVAVGDHRVAFVVPEALQGYDLTGDGDGDDLALMLFDSRTGTVTNLHQATTSWARLHLRGRWLTVEVPRDGEVAGVPRHAVALYDVTAADVEGSRRLLCDDPSGLGFLAASHSDDLVPCVTVYQPDDASCLAYGPDYAHSNACDPYLDRWWDRRTSILPWYRLSVFTSARDEVRDLGFWLVSPYDVQVDGQTMAFGVDEAVQGQGDLDCDGRVGGGGFYGPGHGSFVVHVFDGVDQTVANLRIGVDPARFPLLELTDQRLCVASRTSLAAVLSAGGTYGTCFFKDAAGHLEGVPETCAELRSLTAPPEATSTTLPHSTTTRPSFCAVTSTTLAPASTTTTLPFGTTTTLPSVSTTTLPFGTTTTLPPECSAPPDCTEDVVPCTDASCVAGRCLYTHRSGVGGVECELGRLRTPAFCPGDGVPLGLMRGFRKVGRTVRRRGCRATRIDALLLRISSKVDHLVSVGKLDGGCYERLLASTAGMREAVDALVVPGCGN